MFLVIFRKLCHVLLFNFYEEKSVKNILKYCLDLKISYINLKNCIESLEYEIYHDKRKDIRLHSLQHQHSSSLCQAF